MPSRSTLVRPEDGAGRGRGGRRVGGASATGRAAGADAAGPVETVRVGRALARLSRLLEQSSSAAGLTLAQYRVLVFVADRPQRASALAAKVDVQRATLSAIVAGLEKAGLLRRAAVEHDGRGVQLQLTAAGRGALARVERSLACRLDEVVAAGGVDAAALAGLLEGMLAGFEAVTDRERQVADGCAGAAGDRER